MLTEAQIKIIKEICEIQFKSLDDILINPDLDPDYVVILEAYGCTREDFDKTIIGTRKRFMGLYEDPKKVFELPTMDLIMIRFILERGKHFWVDKYPKALYNLLYKLLTHDVMTNMEFRN